MKIILYGFALLMLFCPTMTGEASPPSSHENTCLAYGYFDGQSFNSYLSSNSYHLGSQLNIISDCENGVIVYIQGFELANISSGRGSVFLESGTWNITLEYGNQTSHFEGVIVITDTQFNDYLQSRQRFEMSGEGYYFSVEEFSDELTSTVVYSSILTWLVVTVIGWRFMAWYTARFHFSEVR